MGERKFVQMIWVIWPRIAAMRIYGKNLSKIFSKTSRPYRVCSNDGPWLILTYFTARSTLLTNALVWKNTEILDFIETIEVYELKVGTSSWLSQYINTYEWPWTKVIVYTFKHLLLQNHLAHWSQISSGAFMGCRLKVCSNGLGLVKVAAMPIHGKKPLKIFISEGNWSMIYKLGIHHQWLRPYKVLSNDDRGLTLTCFTARSTLLPNAFVWENA